MNKKTVLSFLIAFPLAFMLVFFGFAPPRFDAVFFTDNIVGEGSSFSYLSSDREPFAYLYRGESYFGSELKTLRLRDLRYDINDITLHIFDVEEADILSFDISVFGYSITHVNSKGITHPFTRTIQGAFSSEEEPLLHAVIDNPKDGATINLSGFDYIPLWFWIFYFVAIFLVSILVTAVVFFLITHIPPIQLPLLSASTIIIDLILGCFLCGSLPYVDYTDFLLNWLLLFAGSLFINAITLPWLGTITVCGLTTFWYIANFFVISFRGKPIMPADLKAFSTAMEVIDGYTLRPSWKMIVALVVIALYCILVILSFRESPAKKAPLKKKILMRFASAVSAVLIFFAGINTPAFARVNSFAWDARVMESFHREGIVLSFLKNAFNSVVRKPEGYSAETVGDYLGAYQEKQRKGIQPTNIIMVMNEAFSDLRTVGLDPRIDVMPFIDSLDKNTVSGDLYVSVLGGGTCNTEFEALTGNTLAFLGMGAYPYTSNVTRPLFSLASYFEDIGYTAESFHSNRATNWNRNMVYPFLGFERFHSIDDISAYAPIAYLHNLPSDLGDYQYIESVKESKGALPTFLFDVTMQNHSGYEHFEDVIEDETVKQYGSELSQDARVYLSLVKASDSAVQQLIETYQNVDEPTMIIFFGDHQPGMSTATQAGIYNTVSQNLDFFKTKFFIWTNYDTETLKNISISANYLPWLILERGNFPQPPYV
ncbi:MAG: sulfatase-like hydrolase/transferase, partial [Butyrivibrio sp.]|nr:sulfatase-like hydrolase/transferase [Butyrivibrio sp.]